jgi:tetratricopeptide (TPR) repeat protein
MRDPRPAHIVIAVTTAVLVCVGTALGAPTPSMTLRLQQVDREPREGQKAPSVKELTTLAAAVKAQPKDRGKRFALVQGLRRAGKLRAALAAAKTWRARDAYNLVVVRLLGDLYRELGQAAAARRAYSAVVELLPKDPDAQRALATVLKQGGQLKAAYQRLVAAAKLRPEDRRIAFELADVAQRLGREPEATRRFAAIATAKSTPRKIAYPAKQRLAQLYAGARRQALDRGAKEQVATLTRKIDALGLSGGVANDIKIYLTWDTNRTDVDLWVTNPAGQKIYYRNKKGRFGGALYDDVTDGYGPESFTAKRASRGTYLVQVNYFASSRRAFTEARGEVIVVLHEGTAREVRHVLPYRLFAAKQTVTVARLRVGAPTKVARARTKKTTERSR